MTFAQKGFHTIGALKTNRLLYPSGMKKKLSELAAELSVTHNGFDLATVKKRKYYVYRWSIEIFFRQCKDKMALDGYQLRSAQGDQKSIGCLCHWHISCVQWVLVGSVRLKLDITKSVIPFSWKSIVIFFQCAKGKQ